MYNSARFAQCTVYNKLYKRLHSLGRSRHDHMYQELPVMGHKVITDNREGEGKFEGFEKSF